MVVLTDRGVVLPCAVLDRFRGSIGKYGPTLTNGLAGSAVGLTSDFLCSMVRSRGYGTGHVFCLPLHGHVRFFDLGRGPKPLTEQSTCQYHRPADICSLGRD